MNSISQCVDMENVADSFTSTGASSIVVPGSLVECAQPVVLRNFISSWPVVSAALQSDRALCDYLQPFFTDHPLVVYSGVDQQEEKIGYRDDFTGFTFNRGNDLLHNVIHKLLQGSERTLYIGSSRVDRWLPGFRANNDLRFTDVRPVINFWLGNQNTVAAHYDSPHNIACCVAGRRTFTLFPPDQIGNLYIGPVDLTPSGRPISLVDFLHPNFEKFPKFKDALAAAQVFNLEPGDALYIPPLWWHHVQSHAPLNMLVNYWWRQTPEYMGVPDLALEHAILALRGLPESERQAWKAMFDHYVFQDSTVASAHIPEAFRGMLNNNDESASRLGWLNFSKKMKL